MFYTVINGFRPSLV